MHLNIGALGRESLSRRFRNAKIGLARWICAINFDQQDDSDNPGCCGTKLVRDPRTLLLEFRRKPQSLKDHLTARDTTIHIARAGYIARAGSERFTTQTLSNHVGGR